MRNIWQADILRNFRYCFNWTLTMLVKARLRRCCSKVVIDRKSTANQLQIETCIFLRARSAHSTRRACNNGCDWRVPINCNL